LSFVFANIVSHEQISCLCRLCLDVGELKSWFFFKLIWIDFVWMALFLGRSILIEVRVAHSFIE
jgi:hypothetical protein